MIDSLFLLIGGITILGEGRGALEVAGVDAKEDDFSFRFLTVGFNELKVVFSLNKEAKFVPTYFLMVSAFSLSNKRTSHFKTKITSKSSQKLLMIGIKSLLGVFLLVGQFLI